MSKPKLKIFLVFLILLILFLPSLSSAILLGQQKDFFVKSDYDLDQRTRISATLKRVGTRAYYYVDSQWWEELGSTRKQEVVNALRDLDQEFYPHIYNTLTSQFGDEWRPGIDEDSRITILIHPMEEKVAGYFNSRDEYPKSQNSKSNEREMVYLNSQNITDPLAKAYLAQEFLHLITFNQKQQINDVVEEVWLNEARAEYVPEMLGYNSEYEESYLKRRVEQFLEEPSDSIAEWQNNYTDYASINLFVHYLVDHFGKEILIDSLHSKKTGIKSINEALEQNGFDKDFPQIFTNWTITLFMNDCSIKEGKYCYGGENLKDLRISPSVNFLPLKGKSSLAFNQTTKNWSGNWFKFVGGNGTLEVEFIGNPHSLFKVPYISKNISGEYSINFFNLDENQRGRISVPRFGTEVTSVTIIPTVQSKISGFLENEPAVPYFWEASTVAGEKEKINENSDYLKKPISEMTEQELIQRISEIKTLLEQLQEKLSELQKEQKKEEPLSCNRFEKDLFLGMRNDDQVRCLQQFLKSRGEKIYPKGLVTGNFLSLTKVAVIRFQEKHASDILEPWNLEKGTGYVGKTTRAKINEILSEQ